MTTTQIHDPDTHGHTTHEHETCHVTHQHVEIRIDHKPYKTPKNPMTGLELRALAHPVIGPEYDLWLENPGNDDDIKVGDSQEICLKPGMHFYIASATINPGGEHGTA